MARVSTQELLSRLEKAEVDSGDCFAGGGAVSARRVPHAVD